MEGCSWILHPSGSKVIPQPPGAPFRHSLGRAGSSRLPPKRWENLPATPQSVWDSSNPGTAGPPDTAPAPGEGSNIISPFPSLNVRSGWHSLHLSPCSTPEPKSLTPEIPNTQMDTNS